MASRKEQKEQLRQERQQREQQAAAAAARKRLIGIVVGAILVLAIVAAIVVVLLGGDDGGGGSKGGGGKDAAKVSFPDAGKIPEQKDADLKTAAKAGNCTLEEVKSGGAGEHTTDAVKYKTEPPAIGPHYPEWPDDDIYSESPPVTRVVHTLEHGRVVIWVKPDASKELLGQIKALYEEDPYHLLVVPRKEIKEAIAVSAWEKPDKGHILRCPTPVEGTWDAIRAFKEQYRDKGPEFVP